MFWYQNDFNGGTTGNTDYGSYSGNAFTACDNAGSGCQAVSYGTNGLVLKTIVSVPNSDTSMPGLYMKSISGYIITLDLDIHNGVDLSYAGKVGTTSCTSSCTSNSQCIGANLGVNGCILKSSWGPPSTNLHSMSLVKVSQSVIYIPIQIASLINDNNSNT